MSYPMDKKIQQFEKGNILFARTYEHENTDSGEFQLKLENIIRGRLPFNIQQRKLNFQEEFKSYLAEIKTFIEQVNRL